MSEARMRPCKSSNMHGGVSVIITEGGDIFFTKARNITRRQFLKMFCHYEFVMWIKLIILQNHLSVS